MKRISALWISLVSMAVMVASIPSSAVVNGSDILDANTRKPWVAQIYWAEDLGDKPDFICTGSLISTDKILTAAHCVLSGGYFFVSLGARTLNSSSPLLEVDAVWKHNRYSKKLVVNDIGVLKLTNPVLNVQPIALPTTAMTRKINAVKTYKIFGWGVDQNGSDAVYLRTAKLKNQDRVAKRYFKKFGYSSTTMLAASNYLKNEGIYAGACNGDSGGPLVATIKGRETLVGVTGWGISDPKRSRYCDLGYPTVFARVSYYLNDIKKGIITAESSAIVDNRAAPSYSIKPSIRGTVRVGSTITCDLGAWSKNTTSTSFKWTSPYSETSNTSQSISLTSRHAGDRKSVV